MQILRKFSSAQFSHSVMSDSLQPHDGLPVHHQLPEFTQTHGHPAISSSGVPFSCAQSLPASEYFPMSQLFAWGGQSFGVSALAPSLPKNTQGWYLLECTGWISLQSKGLSRVFSNTTIQKHQSFGTQLSSQLTLTSIHDYWKNHYEQMNENGELCGKNYEGQVQQSRHVPWDVGLYGDPRNWKSLNYLKLS